MRIVKEGTDECPEIWIMQKLNWITVHRVQRSWINHVKPAHKKQKTSGQSTLVTSVVGGGQLISQGELF